MSNETIIKQHNDRLGVNNTDLNELFNKINILPNKVNVETHYLEGKNVVIVLTDGSKLYVDISGYIGDNELTAEQIEAINNMNVTVVNNELVIDYDEEVLDFDFRVENTDLIVENNVTSTDFNINENKELEVIY